MQLLIRSHAPYAMLDNSVLQLQLLLLHVLLDLIQNKLQLLAQPALLDLRVIQMLQPILLFVHLESTKQSKDQGLVMLAQVDKNVWIEVEIHKAVLLVFNLNF